MSKETELVRIEKAIGRELTMEEFFSVAARMYGALAKVGSTDAEVEAVIRELKAA